MITAEFDYEAPATLREIIAMIGARSDAAKLLAGGMTLVPMLNLNLLAPELIVALRAATELKVLSETTGDITIGSMTCHRVVASNALVRNGAPLLALAAGLIGDVQVRNRGTIGGSLAHADPAANYLPAVTVLGAIIHIDGPLGPRTLSAKDFFLDALTTALDIDELIVAVTIPKTGAAIGHGFQKFTRVKGNFPIVCAAALWDPVESVARLAIGGITAQPTILSLPIGISPSDRDEAIRSSIEEPMADLNGDAEYKREMAVVMASRALLDAHHDAERKRGSAL